MEKPSVNLGNNKWATKSGGILGYEDGINKNVSPVEFDFSRASSGTTVNRQGLIELVDVSSIEKVVNGDFATDTDWTKGTGWTIGGGSLNVDVSSWSGSTQILPIDVSGVMFNVTYEIIENNSGSSLLMYIGDGNTVNIPRTVGIHSVSLIGYTSNNVFSIGSSLWNGKITNISVKEVLEEYPRIDFSDDVNGALLLEPTSTNLIKYSEDFSNSYWVKSGSNVVQGFVSPDGTTNAYKLVEDASNGSHRSRVRLDLPSSKNTGSVFVKSGERFKVAIQEGGATNDYASYDLSTGTLIEVGGNASYSIELISNDWYRISLTPDTVQVRYDLNVTILEDSYTTGVPNSQPYQGNGTSGIYIYGAQLEQLPYATSYIPNYGNASGVTRVADLCNNGGQVGNFNSVEGILYAEMAALSNNSNDRHLSLSDGSSSNRVDVYYNSIVGRLTARISVAGVNKYLEVNSITQTEFSKIAVKFKLNDYALWLNGVEVDTDTTGSIFSANTLNELSFDDGASALPFYGKLKDLRVYRTALTDDDLVLLTRPSYDSYESMSSTLEYTIR